MRFKQSTFRSWLIAAGLLLSASLFSPAVWGVEGFSSFRVTENFSEAELFMTSDDKESTLELETEDFSFNEKVGGGQVSFSETEFGVGISEVDLLTNVELNIDVRLTKVFHVTREPGTGGPVVVEDACYGPFEDEEGDPLPVDCPVGQWITFTERSVQVSGSFPAKVTIRDPLGGEQEMETTAQVNLLLRATSPIQINRSVENRVLQNGVGFEVDEGEREHFKFVGGSISGRYNRVDQLASSAYEVELSGSILIDGREWLDGVPWEADDLGIGTEKSRFVETSFGLTPCGDAICDNALGENNINCFYDCFCGNGTCDELETFQNCQQDGCRSPCGDGICEFGVETNCLADCFCGNFQCEFWNFESNATCDDDCFCGDFFCNSFDGEDASTCYSDCGRCGDGLCTGPEDVFNCDFDCTVCGDGLCTPRREVPDTCPEDCSFCTNDVCEFWFESSTNCDDCSCGDGICDDGEFTSTCPADCSFCGDTICSSPFEDSSNCLDDCPICGDGICSVQVECVLCVCTTDCTDFFCPCE